MNSSTSKFPRKSVNVDNLHSNTSLEIVEITTDKLKIILSEHIKKAEKANDWQAALGILLTAVASLVSADFRLAFGIEPSMWKTLFVLTLVVSAIWLIRSFVRIFRFESIDKLISRIKNEPQS